MLRAAGDTLNSRRFRHRYRSSHDHNHCRVDGAPARPLRPLLHRDVGALQLLRDALAAHSFHGGAAGRRRFGLLYAACGADLRYLHERRVRAFHPGRLDRRPLPRSLPRGARRRMSDRRRTLLDGCSKDRDVFSGAGADRPGHRPAEAEREHTRRDSLRARGRTARFGILAVLHGHQHRRDDLAADLRLARTESELARWIRLRWSGHARRAHTVRVRAEVCAPLTRLFEPPSPEGEGSRGPHQRRVAARRSDPRPLHLHHSLLGSIRAGRFHPHAVRRSIHAHFDFRMGVPIELVSIGAAALRDRAGAGFRLDVDQAPPPRATEPHQVFTRSALRRSRIPGARAGGVHRPDAACAGQPDVADHSLSAAHAR